MRQHLPLRALCPARARFRPKSDGSNQSWTTTTDSTANSTNPTRTLQSHREAGDRTVDVRSLQTLGPDGNFKPYQDIETETVKVNSTTSRTITRTFVRNDSGARTLFQVTEEEKRTLPSGNSNIVRSTSNPDADGRLQVVQREIQETRKTSPDAQETKTTVMLPSINGGLAPAMQMQETQKRSGNVEETHKTTLLPDGSGRWQLGEVRQSTIKEEGKSRTKEERVSRPDGDGKLFEVTHTVTRESDDGSGEASKSEQTYSIDVPGVARDNSLHLVEQIATKQRTDAAGQRTIKRTERSIPGDPSAGLQVSAVGTDTVRLTSSGAQATQTVQIIDSDGSLGVVSVDMTKSDSARAVEVQIAPTKPK